MSWRLIPLETARWRLARVWFIACAVIFVLLVGQSVGGVYEGRLQGAWSWALPNFVPTLALMISVFAVDAFRPYDRTGGVKLREPFFKLSMGLSIFYLMILLATILAEPLYLTFHAKPKMSPVEFLEISNLWLGPLQGIVVAALGVLFFLKETDPNDGKVGGQHTLGSNGASASNVAPLAVRGEVSDSSP
jgi:hypothetical protein